MTQLGIVGALGRMGRAIAGLATAENGFSVTAVLERTGHEQNQKSYKDITGISHVEVPLTNWDSPFATSNKPTVIIDFSLPPSTLITAEKCADLGIPLVIGTTGWEGNQLEQVQKASAKIPLLISSNMSVGVNLLFSLAGKAASALHNRGFDIEVMEVHHKHKKDAPSGTSRSIEKALLEATGRDKNVLMHGREGITGERPDQQIGSMALRGGDVVGDHTVYFFGEGERIEIKHQATSRDIFARGALDAAKWLAAQKPGLYSMNDVLGL